MKPSPMTTYMFSRIHQDTIREPEFLRNCEKLIKHFNFDPDSGKRLEEIRNKI
jgi:hypothetical protein